MQYYRNRLLYALRMIKHGVRRALRNDEARQLSKRYSPHTLTRKALKILRANGLGFHEDGNPTWWYTAISLNRNEQDVLTQAALQYIVENVRKDAAILGTGCGTGVMLFWLAEQGYSQIDGFDYLPAVVTSARHIAQLTSAHSRVSIWQDDGFHPKLSKNYDLIIALHWVYSAWMGNYGNRPADRNDRDGLLIEFLGKYVPNLSVGGLILIELIDAISDFSVPPSNIYPIRHSSEQVARCAAAVGLSVRTKMFNSTFGHLPRMLYVLKKD